MRDDRRPARSGSLTVLGMVVAGAFPAVGFIAWLLLVMNTTVPVAGGGNVPSIFSPASGHARTLFDLSIFVLAVCGAIFAVVFGLLLWALLKFRRTEENAVREPPQVYGSNQIEQAWTIVP